LKPFAAALVALLGACAHDPGDPRATVDCVDLGTEPAIACEVKHASGASSFDVCWDLRYFCANGVQVTGTGYCVRVPPGGSVTRRIPLSGLARVDQCDTPTKSTVENVRMVLNEPPAGAHLRSW
jgi:hypothetical protein